MRSESREAHRQWQHRSVEALHLGEMWIAYLSVLERIDDSKPLVV